MGGSRSFQTIHYGIDTEVFKPVKCDDEPRFTIAFGAASFDNARKGFKELLASLRILHDEGYSFKCLVFGAGNLPKETQFFEIEQVGKVPRNKLAEVYSRADVFVVPSLYEAFGLTAIEAMACETPVVAFDTGGIPDSVVPFKTGLLAERANVRDLAKKIIWMIEHEEERRQMGMNARTHVLENFTLQQQVDKYMELYNKVLQ
ncbi:MAG: glycosyltransferase family 4 protein [Okeania sp. SIO3C4]|nr:glycosyltransferase family 4 protein [Okeania sp. SIO3C4]